ncbi:Ferredoxin [Mucinivorans hirudinis]|uniref:Ferredoxin n=1 Tax=Mucinivorans hirudinis TaxID=1433126 RepID=A0A060R726_9BACT|nr:Ferredoxin [Mucinivorans hirudinis]
MAMAYKISADLCTACGTCIDECPVEAISPGDVYTIDPSICSDCGTCADVCPVEAIQPA